MSQFWIVVGENNGPSSWPYRHTSEQSAITEAVRLAKSADGKFFVFEAKFSAVKNDVLLKRLSDNEELPF